MGNSYHMLEDTANARRYYETAIRLGNAKAHSNLGILFYDVGKFEQALPQFQESVRLEPNSPLKHHNLGDVFARLGRDSEARAEYRHAAQLCRDELQVNPRNAVNIATLAVLESKLGQRDEARRHAESARALEPGNPDVLYSAAIVYARANDADRALDTLAESIKVGYSRARAARDPELAGVRSDPRFADVMASPRPQGGS